MPCEYHYEEGEYQCGKCYPNKGANAMTTRVGRKVGRTIYREDVLIGVMDTRELAAQVVSAVNAHGAAVALAEAVLAVDASGKRDIPERVCDLARKVLAGGDGTE